MTFINTNQRPIKCKTSKSTAHLSMATCKRVLINFAPFYIGFYLSQEFIVQTRNFGKKQKNRPKINLDYNSKVTLNRFISNKLIKRFCCGRSYCPFYSWMSKLFESLFVIFFLLVLAAYTLYSSCVFSINFPFIELMLKQYFFGYIVRHAITNKGCVQKWNVR